MRAIACIRGTAMTGNQFVKISDAVSRSQGRVDYGLSPQAEDGVVEAAPPKPV
ncbi:MAG: hypothetical protein GDA48_05515 [Hormoscilla sp. GM102CHS1]|nr:hypothetical protein [Hormoscilla sp. GM102CHS1]